MREQGAPADEPQPPQSARFTRETLKGCLGLGCVLLTLPLLWLAVGVGPGWAAHVLPMLAFVAAIGGAAIVARVPGGRAPRSSDPARPLTHSGAAPSIERPASPQNRLMWALAVVWGASALGGYALEVVRAGSSFGLALMFGAGLLLLGQGLLVAGKRLPPPALRWLRLSIYGGALRQSGPLIAIGFVTLAAALFLALIDGYPWGAGGLALLVVALALLAPLARRMPGPRHLPTAGRESRAGGD